MLTQAAQGLAASADLAGGVGSSVESVQAGATAADRAQAREKRRAARPSFGKTAAIVESALLAFCAFETRTRASAGAHW